MASLSDQVHVYGIRHHGPGSARSLLAALETYCPDALLIEGPPDADDLLPLVLSSAMQPPVAILIYAPDEPTYAAYYPFAEYSPEWQAIRWGLSHQVPVRMLDLPQSVQMAIGRIQAQEEAASQPQEPSGAADTPIEQEKPHSIEEPSPVEEDLASAETYPEEKTRSEAELSTENTLPIPEPATLPFDPADPLRVLAEAAGYSESEQWWEHLVEQRRAPADLFAAILEAISALREAASPEIHPIAIRREAAMRESIRVALSEGFQRVAVVCGAWHTPALAHFDDPMYTHEQDSALLDNLPEMEVRATWVPWTNVRLTRQSGYGAGIDSPGWYAHLWSTEADVSSRWMIRVARLLRAEDLDISPAHVIEAVRLAETLAALRERPLPGLAELNEAALTVFCAGSPLPMRLIEEKLIIGDALGSVPPETPMAPLQQDFERETHRLKLPPEAYEKILDLDLRRTFDLERSHLLHRLKLLGIAWGRTDTSKRDTAYSRRSGRGGTFHEIWRLKWQPEFPVLLIEAGQWGSTIAAAASARVCQAAARAPSLGALTGLVEDVLLAELTDAIQPVMSYLQAQAAVSSDTRHLMQALPPLASVLRYGSVRQTDTAMITQVVDGLVERIFIGLPGACAALNDDSAAEMFELILKVDDSITRLADDNYRQDWQRALMHLMELPHIHGLIAGRATRILYDTGSFLVPETARRLSVALSTANEPLQAAAWIEGFLRGSGQLLIHDSSLLSVIHDWLTALPEPTFLQLLPLLRRTFSTFPYPERRSIGQRVKQGRPDSSTVPGAVASADFDLARADAVLPLLAQLFGINPPSPASEDSPVPGDLARNSELSSHHPNPSDSPAPVSNDLLDTGAGAGR
jgi:hypothetical protein